MLRLGGIADSNPTVTKAVTELFAVAVPSTALPSGAPPTLEATAAFVTSGTSPLLVGAVPVPFPDTGLDVPLATSTPGGPVPEVMLIGAVVLLYRGPFPEPSTDAGATPEPAVGPEPLVLCKEAGTVAVAVIVAVVVVVSAPEAMALVSGHVTTNEDGAPPSPQLQAFVVVIIGIVGVGVSVQPQCNVVSVVVIVVIPLSQIVQTSM